MGITIKEVEYIARLARLGLTDEEKTLFCRQLGSILEYIDKLNQIDTSKVEATSHLLSMESLFREDGVGGSIEREDALRNAPEKTDEFFQVPKIIEGQGS